MNFETFEINGPALITPKKFGDARGYFMETFKDEWFRKNIADVTFVQDNQSLSVEQGVIRGLHYQKAPFEQGKLVRCVQGAIWDVAVDIRPKSPSFGQWIGAELNEENAKQLWVPSGFLHGFATLTENCLVQYKVTNPYSKECDAGIAFDDPEINVDWKIDITKAILSDKDRNQPALATLK
ncbi:dTDP-4-dehydrorhamnose 3,5-epimerase [Pseudaquidulcibacter saccharophilus]|uniref:dTDP-4-dehydrorhamnose 3,5-epimerase n=1 Tax=Pseudaquidulcibacter saccharophilus TaxID=2831900 RepID=UPI001EFF3976|nr:dTDP-4-dehydrorhamnose 3,5-epimerase [Pseudaquidulcibacter saccharophilus]